MTENRADLAGDRQDDGGLIILYQPENMIEVFNDSEESNIR